jgi:nitroreductase
MTNPVVEALMTTRAIRRFSDEPVTDDELWTILRAAQQAPSGGNVQPWQFVVVRDPGVRVELARLYRLAYDRYELTLAAVPPQRDPARQASWERTMASSRHLADHLADVPVIVLVLMPTLDWTPRDADGPMDIGRLDASVYPAVQNLMVAARSLGIGSSLTTVARLHQADVLAAVGAPDGFELAALVPLGRPAGSFGVAPRRPVEQVTHLDRWGRRAEPGSSRA